MTKVTDLTAVRSTLETIGRVASDSPGLLPPLTPLFRRFLAKRAAELSEETMKENKDHQTTLRLPENLVSRLDGYADRVRKEHPGPAWTRSDVVRLLLTRALDNAETPAAK